MDLSFIRLQHPLGKWRSQDNLNFKHLTQYYIFDTFCSSRGRVKHGRHFTFKSVLGDTAITLVAPVVTGTLVTAEQPYVVHGPWLQVLIPDQLAQKMITSFEILANPEQVRLIESVRNCMQIKVLLCHV